MQGCLKTQATGQSRRTKTVVRRWMLAVTFAVALAMCVTPSASAQKPFRYSPRVHGPSADNIKQHIARAQDQSLTTNDVLSFQANLQNLVTWLSQTPSSNPQQQSVASNLQQQISSLTPDQMTTLAGNADVGAFNTAVTTLISTQPVPRTPTQSDPPINLALPQYGICAETATGVQPQVPSDAGTDQSLLIALEVLQGLAIVSNDLENLNIEIAGEANNLPVVIIGSVVDFIEFALQTYSDQYQFCDPYDEAAEVRAGYLNTIVIDTDLSNLSDNAINQFTLFGNQLTAFNTDIDNHIATVAGNNTNQFPQIDNQLTAMSTSLTSQTNVIDTDINSHTAAVDADLNNHLAAVDADVKNNTTAINTSIDNHVAQVDSDVQGRDTQIDMQINTFQTLELRMKIEHVMASGLSVESFELPQALGGYLETVRAIVADTISKMLVAGQAVGTATKSMGLGDTALAAKLYKAAYQDYAVAYQTAVK